MVNVALNGAGRLELFKLGAMLLAGDYPIRQLVLCEEDFGWMALSGSLIIPTVPVIIGVFPVEVQYR
jgi:hypothetical protein